MIDGEDLSLCIDRNLRAARQAVVEVRQFLASRGVKGQALEDCELAVAEACNNAVLHNPVASGLRILTGLRDGFVEVRLIDHGPGFNFPEIASLPSSDSESGRGLFLIKSLMDEAKLERHGSRHELILRKRVLG